MLLLSNDDVAAVLDVKTCIEAMEDAYRELGEQRGASGVRSEILAPTTRADGLYSLLTMSGVAPKSGVGAVRINSDILIWPRTAAGLKRVKVPAAPGERYVGLRPPLQRRDRRAARDLPRRRRSASARRCNLRPGGAIPCAR